MFLQHLHLWSADGTDVDPQAQRPDVQTQKNHANLGNKKQGQGVEQEVGRRILKWEGERGERKEKKMEGEKGKGRRGKKEREGKSKKEK